jgi:glucosylceramidase
MTTINAITLPDSVTQQQVLGTRWDRKTDHPLQDDTNISIFVQPDQGFQTWTGFGGAVSELGAQAVQALSAEKQDEFFQAVFGKEGLGLEWIRVPLGSSDFDLDAYSYSETPEDYDQRHFSIDRDKNLILPYIRAAKAVNPNLKLHASPWSPPGWMKQSGLMDGGGADSALRDDPRVLGAYALYLRLAVEAYAGEGLPISRLMVQNEMDSASAFPTCKWSPELFVRFHLEHLKPELDSHDCDVEVWGGTFRTVKGIEAHQCFANPDFRAFVQGCAFQYSFPEVMRDLSMLYPGTRFMHTESVCHCGRNAPEEAVAQFINVMGCMKTNMDTFSYWNVVLNQEGTSSWGWKQNSLVTADTESGKLVYNPDYRVFKFLSEAIPPGAVRVMSFSYLKDTLAFRNPDGSGVVLLRNLDGPRKATLQVNNVETVVELPGNALCAVPF